MQSVLMYELASVKHDLTNTRKFLFLTPESQVTIKLQFPVDTFVTATLKCTEDTDKNPTGRRPPLLPRLAAHTSAPPHYLQECDNFR